MTQTFRKLIIAGIAAGALAISPASAQTQLGDMQVSRVPSELEVPSGNTAFLKTQAEGTQNYVCLPSATGYSWTFSGPQATLFVVFKWFNSEVRQQVTTHFLSPNPVEGGTPRATWQSSLDTSKVWGRAIASYTGSDYVAPGAISWLLLQVVGSQQGPTGGMSLKQATYIQRINTAGGVMPSTGCSAANNVGATAFVPYTTEYVFYRPVRRD